MEDEIKKRGLVYHAVGHAWTCEPLGIPGLGWEPEVFAVNGRTSALFAQVGGKRELWEGIPLNTNLCYSNPEARRLMIEYAVSYLSRNKKVDVLHFWLADGKNNHCECESCKNTLPSDFYIKLLNELDEKLTEKGISTKVVFLLYYDLLWAPLTERLNNPERFILMFAPITRTYSKTYSMPKGEVKLPPYERNKLKFPSNIEDNISFLKSWQSKFKGDSFAYEYHFMWDHYFDPGYYSMAKVLFSDIKNLASLGLNGLISDQTQRSFFPTGFGMYVMGRTMWDSTLDFNQLAEEYFNSAFGECGSLCKNYMEEISGLFDPPYLREEKPAVNKEAAEKLGQIPDLIEAFKAVIEKNLGFPTNAIKNPGNI